MKTAVVTGACGFIGARLVLELLRRGVTVQALGRGRHGRPWPERMIAALDDVDGVPAERPLLSRLHCLEADLLRPDLGLPRPKGQDKTVLFHVAADTRFTPPDAEAQRQTNVVASLNVMRHYAGAVRQAVHVSTAYVAGNRRGRVLESELDSGQTFRNTYEKTKFEAEAAVTDLCMGLGVPLAIVRPSIITNDTRTGRSSALTHLNALVEVIGRVQEHFGLRDGEVVSRSIRIPIDPDSRPNLAPVDPIVTALLQIGSDPRTPGRTYHLCHPLPESNARAVALLGEAFGVTEAGVLEFVTAPQQDATWTEKMFARSLKPYLPYMNENCEFDLTNTRSILPDYDSRFPPMDLGYLTRVIRFCRSKDGERVRRRG